MLVEQTHNPIHNELIAHKILFNLNQTDQSSHLSYSTMVYPFYPLYSAGLAQAASISTQTHERDHIVDVVFIHGLRGSVFVTWRQDDEGESGERRRHDEAKLIDALSHLITRYFDLYSHCWPKDWLPLDLVDRAQKADDDVADEPRGHEPVNYRLMGINYDTLYSLWGEELVDDKKLKLSIKQRAIDLAEQLALARVGVDRPVIWICHSMGGLIVKQMLVDSVQLFANTRAIIFLSTPHLGSGAAAAAAKLAFATKPSTEIIELSTNSKYLIELNEKFLRCMAHMDK